MAETNLESELLRLTRLEQFQIEEAKAGYERLVAAHPGSAEAKIQYAWFLTDLGAKDAAMALAREVLAERPEEIGARFVLSLGSTSLGDYETAVEEFAGLFAALPPPHLPDSPCMYFCFLVMRSCDFDPAKAQRFLQKFFADHPALVANGTRDAIAKLMESRIHQVYGQGQAISGFLLFVDLVNSTQYKRDFPELWPDRIVHFLMYTKYAFRTLGFDFIKFIGDEVMLFLPFDAKTDKAEQALSIYRFIFSRHSWYLDEVNRFNPALKGVAQPEKSPHRIAVKLALGEVTGAKVFHPYYDQTYDLIGRDVDRIARIKEMGHENLVIADQGFYEALIQNGPDFAEALSTLRWRQKFKGIDEEVRFYGKPLK
ncbi:MAG TPA: tetratricopeptide repeat protein [Myxococcales bacterium]|jgi:class 3 adenylate cyclase